MEYISLLKNILRFGELNIDLLPGLRKHLKQNTI